MLTISETMTHEINEPMIDGINEIKTDESNKAGAKKGKVNPVFRGIALALHAMTMLFYYIPTLVMGSSMATIWLVVGVIHTGLFCLMYDRKTRRRRVLSVIILILLILWCGIWVVMTFPVLTWSVSLNALFFYMICSLFAAIFALAFPRKV